jgi:hypothetical protein
VVTKSVFLSELAGFLQKQDTKNASEESLEQERGAEDRNCR